MTSVWLPVSALGPGLRICLVPVGGSVSRRLLFTAADRVSEQSAPR